MRASSNTYATFAAAALVCAVFAGIGTPSASSAEGDPVPPQTTSQPSEAAVAAVASVTVAQKQFRTDLESAHRLLSEGCSAALFLELRQDDSKRSELLRAAREAQETLESARRRLETLGQADERDAMEAECERLEIFSSVFVALGSLDKSDASQRTLIAACGELAALFDMDDKYVAESAKLWQGVAYRRAGRPDRALQVLRPVLARPASPVIGLWARLERARALGDQKQYVAGITLCLRLESLVKTWFKKTPGDAEAAERSIRMVHAELLRGWSVKLSDAGHETEAKQAESQARKIVEGLLRVSESQRWLRLSRAIEVGGVGTSNTAAEQDEAESAEPESNEAIDDHEESEEFDDPIDDEAEDGSGM